MADAPGSDDLPFLSGYAEKTESSYLKVANKARTLIREHPFTSAGLIRLVGGGESALSGIASGNDARMVAGFVSMGSELSLFLLGDKLLFKMIDKARSASGFAAPKIQPPAMPTPRVEDSATLLTHVGQFLKQSVDVKNNPKDFALLLGFVGSVMYANSGIQGFLESDMAPDKLAELIKAGLLASGFSVGRFMQSRNQPSDCDRIRNALPEGALKNYYDSIRNNPSKFMGDLLLGATGFTLVNAASMAAHQQSGWGHELFSGAAFGTANYIIRNFGRIQREKAQEK